MNDGSTTYHGPHIPRVPPEETLYLELDGARLRIVTRETNEPRTVDEINLCDIGAETIAMTDESDSCTRSTIPDLRKIAERDGARFVIDENCLLWAEWAAAEAGLLVIDYHKITDVLCEMRGPKYMINRLVLTLRDDGYQLHDTTTTPPKRIHIGDQDDPSLEDVQIVTIAACHAQLLDYRPVAYRQVGDRRWELLEYPRPVPSSLSRPVAETRVSIETPYLTVSRQLRQMLLSMIVGALTVLVVEGVGWAPYANVVAVAILCTQLLDLGRRTRRRLVLWQCGICYDQGVKFTCETPLMTIDAVRRVHLAVFHGKESDRKVEGHG